MNSMRGRASRFCNYTNYIYGPSHSTDYLDGVDFSLPQNQTALLIKY